MKRIAEQDQPRQVDPGRQQAGNPAAHRLAAEPQRRLRVQFRQPPTPPGKLINQRLDSGRRTPSATPAHDSHVIELHCHDLDAALGQLSAQPRQELGIMARARTVTEDEARRRGRLPLHDESSRGRRVACTIAHR
nr:hypothetical protein [Salinicola acroporae]